MPAGLRTPANLALVAEFNALSKQWAGGEGVDVTESDVVAEDTRHSQADLSSVSQRRNTGESDPTPRVRGAKKDKAKAPLSMSVDEVREAILKLAPSAGFTIQMGSMRERRARVITDASEFGSGMGQGRGLAGL